MCPYQVHINNLDFGHRFVTMRQNLISPIFLNKFVRLRDKIQFSNIVTVGEGIKSDLD